jgi:hypothetical protein
MYPQLSESQKSVISLYLQAVQLLNDNKDPVHTPVLTTVHDLLLDELKESLKNHSLGDKIQAQINSRDSSYNKLMSQHTNPNNQI